MEQFFSQEANFCGVNQHTNIPIIKNIGSMVSYVKQFLYDMWL